MYTNYKTQTSNKKLLIDTIFFIFSIIFGVYLINSGILNNFFNSLLPNKFFAEIFAGFLYTSFLTAPLSIASIIILAKDTNPIVVALVAGLGAMIADIIVIKFFKNRVFEDFNTLSKDLKLKHFFHFFKSSHYNHLFPFIGLILIASPFPDEIGLILLGLSRLKFISLSILTYVFSSLGIFIIAGGAKLFL